MSDFYELAHHAEAHPESADFAALRRAYQASPHYIPFKHIPQAKLLQMTNAADDFGAVAETCQNILKANPMDLEARMMLAVAQEKLGQSESAHKNHLFAEKMLDAILAEGDGKSWAGAFPLVAENEAWTVLRSFGIRAKSHTRQKHEGEFYDVFEGETRQGDTVTVYFRVTAMMGALDELLGDTQED